MRPMIFRVAAHAALVAGLWLAPLPRMAAQQFSQAPAARTEGGRVGVRSLGERVGYVLFFVSLCSFAAAWRLTGGGRRPRP